MNELSTVNHLRILAICATMVGAISHQGIIAYPGMVLLVTLSAYGLWTRHHRD